MYESVLQSLQSSAFISDYLFYFKSYGIGIKVKMYLLFARGCRNIVKIAT